MDDADRDTEAQEELARILEIVAKDGLDGPRDMDVALDAIGFVFSKRSWQQGQAEAFREAAKIAGAAISDHHPDASFDDSMAGVMSRQAMLENVARETVAAILSRAEASKTETT